MAGYVGVKIGGEEKRPKVIFSELLRHLKKTSEDFLCSPIDCAVVTIPVYYTENQKCLTECACHAAGFKNIHFISEPVAAAVAYGLKSSPQSHEAKTCIIYKLGGGTFDVTVFRLDAKNRVEVKATGGDDRIGGEDFNNLITEFCITEFQRIHRVNLAEGKTSEDAEVRKKIAKKLRRIRNECERQKCFLSSATITSVVVLLDCIYEHINLHVTVTRSKFEELIQSLLDRSMKILDETLKKSGFEKEEIDDVILIGGSSRIPKVQQMVQEYFAGKQIRRTIDADEAVACGAAVHAYNVFKENAAPYSVVTLMEEIRWESRINGVAPEDQQAAVAVGNVIYSFGEVNFSDDVLTVFALNVNDREKKWKKLSAKNSEVNPNQREGHSAVAHKDFVLIFGGYDYNKGKKSNSTYRFNTLTFKWDQPKVTRDKWWNYKNVPAARFHHTAVVVRNKMYIYGGSGKGVTNELHSLDLNSFLWSTIATQGIPPSIRSSHSATVHDDRFILIFGGWDDEEKEEVNTIASFDLQSKTWTAVKTRGTPPSGREGHCAFVHNQRMYIYGGINANNCLPNRNKELFNDVFCYDPETLEWKEVTPDGDAPPPRYAAGCVALNDQVFIFGGLHLDEEDLGDTYVLQMQMQQS